MLIFGASSKNPFFHFSDTILKKWSTFFQINPFHEIHGSKTCPDSTFPFQPVIHMSHIRKNRSSAIDCKVFPHLPIWHGKEYHKSCALSISAPSTITIFCGKASEIQCFCEIKNWSRINSALLSVFRVFRAFICCAWLWTPVLFSIFLRWQIAAVCWSSTLWTVVGSIQRTACLGPAYKVAGPRPCIHKRIPFQETADQWASWDSQQIDIAHCSVVFIRSRRASILAW